MPTIHSSCEAHVDFEQGTIIDRDGIYRFTWEPGELELGPDVKHVAHACEVLLDFIRAYIERPREFRREPWMNEQAYKHWWLYGFCIDDVLNHNIEDIVEE